MNRNLPYLPGLDGLRGLAVVAVIVYHADSRWLPGGFLGVEVFFVLSGYLITLLLLSEHERTGHIDLPRFYAQRARRLLPALLAMLMLLTIYTAALRRDALGEIRGDVIAALTYVSNWYQIRVGQGYTATGDFVPLRHLWSLAVEEQFYVMWPLLMIALLRFTRTAHRRAIGYTFAAISLVVAGAAALSFRSGHVGSCAATPEAYWQVAGRCVSRTDVLYLSTPTRAGGLLLGAALAMMWRPRTTGVRVRQAMEAAGAIGLGALGILVVNVHVVTADGPDPWLFRGGFFLTGLATAAVIAAAATTSLFGERLLGTAPLLWVGVRSYGLYLYHWPIFQAVRGVAGNALSVREFGVAMALTVLVTELSYRLLETPIRRRTGPPWRSWLAPGAQVGHRLASMVLAVVLMFATISVAAAPLRPNQIALAQQQAEQFVGDPFAPNALESVVTAPAVASTAAATLPPTVPPTLTASVPLTIGSTVAPPTTAPAPTPPPATALSTVASTTPVTAPPTAPAPTASPEPPPTQPIVDSAPPASAPPLLPVPAAVWNACEATPVDRYALGDSVMVGAAEQLSAAGFCVDAAQSRFFAEGLERVTRLNAEARLGSTVVVALGTNGEIEAADLANTMLQLSAVPRVVVVTAKADRPWVAPSNERLRALPATYPNVVVVDWEWHAGSCPGSCFWEDGIHLRPAGRSYYAQLIIAAAA